MKTLITSAQVVARGWTKSLIRRLLTPDKCEEYRANGWDIKRHYYALTRVVAIERSKAFQGAKKRSDDARQSRTPNAIERRNVRRVSMFERKYKTANGALPDACEAMFNLNRYAKHQSCSRTNADEIYELKYALIRALYILGFSRECKEHSLPGKRCYSCNGTGRKGTRGYLRDWHDQEDDVDDPHDNDDQSSGCHRCGGTGWYVEPSVLVLFRFSVADKTYAWHVPGDRVSFDYKTSSPSCAWQPNYDEKPITLSPTRFAQSKALVRWVVNQKAGAIDLKMRIAKNLAYQPPGNTPHGESLVNKLIRLGHDSPSEAAKDICEKLISAQQTFRDLRAKKIAAFKKRIAQNLAFEGPVHKGRGPSLQARVFALVPRGTADRNQIAQNICGDILSGNLSYREAVTMLGNRRTQNLNPASTPY